MTWVKYTTALAWIWGVIGALPWILKVTGQHPEPFDRGDSVIFLIGIASWAWLLARYVL